MLELDGSSLSLDLTDNSDRIVFGARVVSDRAANVGGVSSPDLTLQVADRPSFSRHNADVDARYQIVQPLAVTVGGGWERWNRGPEREVREQDEIFAKAAIGSKPTTRDRPRKTTFGSISLLNPPKARV